MATATLDPELERLIASQARDDATDRLPAEARTVRECELAGPQRRGWSLDDLPEPLRFGFGWGFSQLLGLGDPWERVVHDLVHAGLVECPGCRGEPLGFGTYCLVCDRAGLDGGVARGRVELPGLAVDSILNPGWTRSTSRKPDNRAGGLGRRGVNKAG